VETDYTHTSATANSQGYTLAVANAAFAPGSTLRITAHGNAGGLTGTVGNKTLNVYVDGAPFAQLTLPVAYTGDFEWVATVLATGWDGQNISARLVMNDGNTLFDHTTDTTDFNDGGTTNVGLAWNTENAQDTIAIYDTVVEYLP